MPIATPQATEPPAPSGFTVEDAGGTLSIQWRSRPTLGVDSAVVLILSAVAMVVFAAIQGQVVLLLLALPLALFACGSFSKELNTSRLELDPRRLSIQERAFPLSKQRTLERASIARLSFYSRTVRENRITRRVYSVEVWGRRREHQRLVEELQTLDEARWLATVLASRLGLPAPREPEES
jgi:hypothetical protein